MDRFFGVETDGNPSAQCFGDYALVEMRAQESERLLSALSSLCTRENTDVGIRCGGLLFYCHAVILKARSTLFCRILESPSKPNVVNISEVNPDVMENVITFIYSGQL